MEEVLFRCSNSVGSVTSSWGACLFSRGPVARPPIKAARDMGAGDDGAVCGRRDGLPTRISVFSRRRTVLELVESGVSERSEVVEEVSKREAVMSEHRPVNADVEPRPTKERAYQQKGRGKPGHSQYYDVP